MLAAKFVAYRRFTREYLVRRSASIDKEVVLLTGTRYSKVKAKDKTNDGVAKLEYTSACHFNFPSRYICNSGKVTWYTGYPSKN
jgi:hypothetical protein